MRIILVVSLLVGSDPLGAGLEEVELLDVVIPQHGGSQLGVEVGVVPGAPHYLVLGVDWGEHKTGFSDLTESQHNI